MAGAAEKRYELAPSSRALDPILRESGTSSDTTGYLRVLSGFQPDASSSCHMMNHEELGMMQVVEVYASNARELPDAGFSVRRPRLP
jgi:hypothetical protein